MVRRNQVILVGSLLVVIMMLAGAGCDRHLESRDPVRSLPDVPATPTSLSIVINDQSMTLSWQVSNSAGIDRYRIYRTTDLSLGFAVADSSTTTSIVMTGLAVNQQFYFRVAAVTASGIEGERSEIVSAVSGILSIRINNDAAYTANTFVQIQLLTAGPTSYVVLSNDSLFTDSVVLPFASQVSFTLSDGDGQKRVYARYMFSDGSRSGKAVSDDIILDTRAQINTVGFSPVSTFRTGDTILFLMDVGEPDGRAAVSFGTVSNYPLFNDGTEGDAMAGDSLFSARYIVPPGFTVTDEAVTGSFTDEAGNNAVSIASADHLTIATPLEPVQLTAVEALSSFEISLIWTKSVVSQFESYRIYRDQTAGVSKTATLVSTITNPNTTSFVDAALNDSSKYYYVVYVRNSEGGDTASNELSATTLSNQPPLAVTVAGQLDSAGTSAVLSWTQNVEPDFASYRIYRDTINTVSDSSMLVGLISSRTVTSFTDFIPTGVTTEYYRIYVYDRHGASTPSNIVQVTK